MWRGTRTYLAAGYFCLDENLGAVQPGGTAYYAAATARHLGWHVHVLTSGNPDELPEELADMQVSCRPSSVTTRFINDEQPEGRSQWLLTQAPALTADEVVEASLGADVIHLGPIASEMPDNTINALPDTAWVGATIQGWMRGVTADREVVAQPPSFLARWRRPADAVVLSEEDWAEATQLARQYPRAARIWVVTRGAKGCLVGLNGDWHEVPSIPVRVADPTGAGDVFAAAFFVYVREGLHPILAARHACVAAALSITGIAAAAIPDRDSVAQAV